MHDRAIEVAGGIVTVTVPVRQFIDFATCPGGESHALFNLPGLAAGQYTLVLATRSASGEIVERHEIPLTVQPQGSADADAIRAIPGPSSAALAGLALSMLLIAARQSKRSAS